MRVCIYLKSKRQIASLAVWGISFVKAVIRDVQDFVVLVR